MDVGRLPDGVVADSPPRRVLATDAARALLAEVRAVHGPVLFHQSGGCCDGSAPMCYPIGDFRIGERDVLLGEIDGAKVWIGGRQFVLWAHTQLILDAVPGRGASFSLEAPTGRRFLTRSRVFTPEEQARLPRARRGPEGRPAEEPEGPPPIVCVSDD
ncbi:MAG: DUF779 domain-containing protein [Pseudomonadota bacterium]|nr:DUF779 domain-containing protein [Pseudomonadota bacterium]